jgi:hypothetical protein
MKQRPAELLLYPAVLAGLAAFLYALNWRHNSATMLHEIRATLKQNGNKTHQASELLSKQHRAIKEFHAYLLPVTKGSTKAAS